MMRLKVDINGVMDILNLYVVRVKPTHRNPEDGELCTYELYRGSGERGSTSELLTEFQFPYGDGILLSAEMLEVYQSVLECDADEAKYEGK